MLPRTPPFELLLELEEDETLELEEDELLEMDDELLELEACWLELDDSWLELEDCWLELDDSWLELGGSLLDSSLELDWQLGLLPLLFSQPCPPAPSRPSAGAHAESSTEKATANVMSMNRIRLTWGFDFFMVSSVCL